jgi:hypothetical protein
MRNIYNSLVYHYEIYIPGYTEPLDSKICFSSALRALAKGRSLKKEHGATKVRIDNTDTLETYWV